MTRTRTGRVVYNRAPHLFRYTDVQRIVHQVRPAGGAQPGGAQEGAAIVGTILAAEADLLSFVGSRGIWNVLPAGEASQLGIQTASLVVDLLAEAPQAVVGTILQILTGSKAQLTSGSTDGDPQKE